MKLLSAMMLFLLSFVANAHHEKLVETQVIHDLFHLVTDVSIFMMPVVLVFMIIKLAYK